MGKKWLLALLLQVGDLLSWTTREVFILLDARTAEPKPHPRVSLGLILIPIPDHPMRMKLAEWTAGRSPCQE